MRGWLHIGLAAAFAQPLLFGIHAGVVAGMSVPGLLWPSLVGLSSGSVMLAVGLAFGGRLSLVSWRLVGMLCAIATLNSGSYLASLQLAPAGPAAALHLISPVLLMLWAIHRKERRLGIREVAIMVALLAGSSICSLEQGDDHGGRLMVVGLGLALLSAFALATLSFVVNRFGAQLVAGEHPQAQLLVYNGATTFLGGAVLAGPAIALWGLPAPSEFGVIAAAGALLFFPAAAAGWFALTRLAPTTVTSIALLEAPVAAVVAWLAFSLPLQAAHALGAALILAGVGLELRQGSRKARRAVGSIQPQTAEA